MSESTVTERHPLLTIEVVVLVAIGGFAGANLRYLAAQLAPGLAGTLVANVLGATALGFLLYEAQRSGLLADRTHVVVGTGFLSSFTTYSTFVVQSAQSTPLALAGNVVATYALGFAGVAVGRHLAVVTDRRWST